MITARAALAVVFGMTFWAVAPLVIGWQTTTVMTGSMEPAIQPGDLVVSRPIDPAELRPGQVILVTDPDHPGRLRLHRLHAVDGDELITKGDANPEADSSPVLRSDVLGVGALRVPWIGIPIQQARDGDAVGLTSTVLGLVAIIGIALAPAIASGAGDPPEPDPELPERTPSRDAETRRVRSRTAAFVVAVTVAAVVAASPAHAAAFSARTQTSGSLQAATPVAPSDLTCANNFDGSVTIGWAYDAERPYNFEILVDGRGSIATLGPDARSIQLRANTPFSFGRTSVVRVRTNLTQTWGATSSDSRSVTTVTILWVGVARCA
ncbi:signal peptidase I [Microbacterium testaceum StLB037]|uniref:Signal peptidase I n=1 Tax=Microbacterium testaceum (strain StLB037) TaxID=979556 RepID=E8N8Y0_MICTS|nr:signal peptidase I [Microbacterium testaceum]BAJ73189.1 signal peptidase I [Microbacterium testaceum StLB037]